MEFLLILSWTVTTYLSVLVLMMLVRVVSPKVSPRAAAG